MKKLFLTLTTISFVIISACSSNASGKENSNEKLTLVEKANPKETNTRRGAIHLTKEDFLKKVMNYEKNPNEWIYLGDKPAIIDFYADWCRPCKIAAPVLDELAVEYKNDIYVYKINTEKERELAAMFGISSIPAFLFIPKNGKPQMSNGIARTPEETKKMFKGIIDEFLLGNTSK